MTDLEMTKLCAEAMGWHTAGLASKVVSYAVSEHAIIAGNDRGGESVYDPLTDDAQAMQLVERFDISLHRSSFDVWHCRIYDKRPFTAPLGLGEADDLNRAIVECVANMQVALTQSA